MEEIEFKQLQKRIRQREPQQFLKSWLGSCESYIPSCRQLKHLYDSIQRFSTGAVIHQFIYNKYSKSINQTEEQQHLRACLSSHLCSWRGHSYRRPTLSSSCVLPASLAWLPSYSPPFTALTRPLVRPCWATCSLNALTQLTGHEAPDLSRPPPTPLSHAPRRHVCGGSGWFGGRLAGGLAGGFGVEVREWGDDWCW